MTSLGKDKDYPNPFCIEMVLLMPFTVAVGLVRLAVSPSFRRTYRERQRHYLRKGSEK
jgi:hypothetical protein